jgi:ABC-type transporter Mla maintaining outer membrane lipid asymmetry ATPase subunit MlaF
MTILDNILFPLVEGRGLSRKQALPQALEIAEKLGVQQLLNRYPDQISNGERKRSALARALIIKPDIMIYDEPTTGQDPMMMHKVDEMIVEANRLFQITSIVISHDMSSTFRIADQIAMVYKGELLIAGDKEALLQCQDPRVQTFIHAH